MACVCYTAHHIMVFLSSPYIAAAVRTYIQNIKQGSMLNQERDDEGDKGPISKTSSSYRYFNIIIIIIIII